MDISYLKQYIVDNNKINAVLEHIGCHSIRYHNGADDNYYTCANKDGDNPTAIVVYCNSSLKCMNYTRELNNKKSDHDLIDLVMFNEDINFFHAVKLLCEVAGIDYYDMENEQEVPESIKLCKFIAGMDTVDENEYDEEFIKVTPKPEHILEYYQKCVNDLFKDDNVSYKTQLLFELGFDPETNMITIPIRDELGNLIGVKGRHLNRDIKQNKYTYLVRCPRGRTLYNLFRAYKYIDETGFVIVVESEKAVMQLYDMGIYNAVALSGSKLTFIQLRKLMNLHVDIVFALDKDIPIEKLQGMANKFPLGYNIYAIIDEDNVLNEKESPTDNPKKWEKLWGENLVKL